MTRVVIEGSARNPITVRPNDLPPNADHSYLRHVRLTGKWGARRSLRYVDVVDSEVDADLSAADITVIESYHSDWKNVTLSIAQEKATSCCVDIRRGVINALARVYPDWPITKTRTDAILDALNQHEGRSEIDPRRILIKAAEMAEVDVSVMVHHARLMISQKPHIFSKINAIDRLSASTPRGLVIFRLRTADKRDTIVPESEYSQPMKDAISRHDRWTLARAAEDEALTKFGVEIVAFCWSVNRPRVLHAITERLLTHPAEFGFLLPDDMTRRDRMAYFMQTGKPLGGPRG